jgi:hypothetical protein
LVSELSIILFPSHTQQEFLAIAAAVSGNRGELFFVPLHGKPGADSNGSLHPQASPRSRSVFHRGREMVGRPRRVFPGDLSHGPHEAPRLEAAPIHAMSIGVVAWELSY